MKQLGIVIVVLSLLMMIKAIDKWADGDSTMLAIVLAVLLLLVGGVVFVNRKLPLPPDLADTRPETGMDPEAGADLAGATHEPHQAIYSVVQTGGDGALDRVERLLLKDPRITEILSESGQWYATPERDDLPEWYALRVYCPSDEVDQVMSDGIRRVEEELGEGIAERVTFSRFS